MSLVGEYEFLDPLLWWSFPTHWPAFMQSELRRHGYSRCHLIKTSHDVAVFPWLSHGTWSCCVPQGVQHQVTLYRALAATEYRDVVMSILEDFDTYLGHVVVARWEDGVTLDKVDKEQRDEVAKIVTELVLGINEAGFVHGDLHVGNVIVGPCKRTAPPCEATALRVTLIDLDDLDDLRSMTPTGRESGLRDDKAGLDRIRRELSYNCR